MLQRSGSDTYKYIILLAHIGGGSSDESCCEHNLGIEETEDELVKDDSELFSLFSSVKIHFFYVDKFFEGEAVKVKIKRALWQSLSILTFEFPYHSVVLHR